MADGLYLHCMERQVKPLPQLLHPFGAGFQRPQEPPSPSGHDAAAVVAGGVAVTVIVRVLVLVLFEVVGGFPETVTMTVEVDVDNGVTSNALDIGAGRYSEAAWMAHQ